jgi:hypothetical protein
MLRGAARLAEGGKGESEAVPGGARREAVLPCSSVVGLADERMTEGGAAASVGSVGRSATAVKPQSGKVETVAARGGVLIRRSRALFFHGLVK